MINFISKLAREYSQDEIADQEATIRELKRELRDLSRHTPSLGERFTDYLKYIVSMMSLSLFSNPKPILYKDRLKALKREVADAERQLKRMRASNDVAAISDRNEATKQVQVASQARRVATTSSFPETIQNAMDAFHKLSSLIAQTLGQQTPLAKLVFGTARLESAMNYIQLLEAYNARANELLPDLAQQAAKWSAGEVESEIRNRKRDLKEVSDFLQQYGAKVDEMLFGDSLTGLKQTRRIVQDAIHKLEALQRHGPKPEPKLKPASPTARAVEEAERMAEGERYRQELITNLERQCEEDCRKNPRQADSIRRRYRKIIDGVMEE